MPKNQNFGLLLQNQKIWQHQAFVFVWLELAEKWLTHFDEACSLQFTNVLTTPYCVPDTWLSVTIVLSGW